MPLSSYQHLQEREEDRRNFTCYLDESKRRCRERVREDRQRRHGLVD
jgi:hypothetical protein